MSSSLEARFFRYGFVAVTVLLAGYLCFIPKGVSAQSAGWVDGHVEWSGGSPQNTVVGWENQCTQDFADNKISMAGNSQRNIVNASAYIDSTWVSRAGDPTNTSNGPINSGTSVNMQINQLGFLCAIVTLPQSGFWIDPGSQVTYGNYPNDRGPVPDYYPNPNQASRFESNSQIDGVSISSGSGLGTLSNVPTGQVLHYARDNNSRYWSAGPLGFTFNVDKNVPTGNYMVQIRVDQTNIMTYHQYGSSGTSRCNSHNVAYGNFGACNYRTEYYNFTLSVKQPYPPYNLAPSVGYKIKNPAGNVVPGNVAQVGDTVTYTYAVINSGGPSDGSTVCNIYGNSHAGYFAVPTPPESSSSGGYVAPGTGCPRVFGMNTTTVLNAETYVVTTGDVNHTICRSLWIDPTKVGGGAAGNEGCVLIAAQPYFKVFGGDLSVGNGISVGTSTGCTQNNTGSVSSWNNGALGFTGAGVQFAAMALQKIDNFATAQSISGAGPASGLAFSNTVLSGSYGGSFGALPCIPDYSTTVANAQGIASPVNLSSLTGIQDYSATGTVSISGNVTSGKKVVLYVTGNAYISGDITYPGSWTSDKIPLFELIVKGNIYIDPHVKQLDGVYIAEPNGASGGGIYTCATIAGPVGLDGNLYNTCNTQLTINGLFSAAEVELMRSYGTLSQSVSGENSGNTKGAEVFNYNPTLWIAQPPAISNGSSLYDAITSLPPIL